MATHGARGASGFSGYQGNQGRGSQNVRWHNGYQYVWSDNKHDFVRWVKIGRNNVPILYKDVLAGKTEEQCIAKHDKRHAKEVNRRINPSRSLIKNDFQKIWDSEERNGVVLNEKQVAEILKTIGYDETQSEQLARAYRGAYTEDPLVSRRYSPDYASKQEIRRAKEVNRRIKHIKQRRKPSQALIEKDFKKIRVSEERNGIRLNEKQVAEILKTIGYDGTQAAQLAKAYPDPYSVSLLKGGSGNSGISGTAGTSGTSGNTANIRQKGPDYAIEQAFKQRPTSADEVKKLFLSYGYSETEANDLTGVYVKKYGALFPPSANTSLFTSPLTSALKTLPDLKTKAGKQAFEAKIKAILDQRTPEQVKRDEDNIKTYKRMYDLYAEYSKIYKKNRAFAEEIRSVVFGDKSLPPEPQKRDRKWVEWRLKKMAVDYTQEAVKDAQNEGEKLTERDAIKKGLYKAERRLCSIVKDRFHTFEAPENRAIRQLLLPNSSPDSANRQFAKNCAWNVVNVDDHEIEFHLKKQAERAFDIIGQIADNIGVDLTQYPKLSQIKLTAISDADYDGKYYPSSNTVEMTLRGLDKNTKLDTMVHELAHAVEFAVPGLRLTAALFRDEISDGTVVAHTNDDDKDNIYGSTIEVPDQYSMREYKATDEQSEIFSVFAQYLTSNPQDACVRSREFYEKFAKALDRRNRLNAMVSAGTVTPDEKNFVHEYENKLDAALSRNNIKVALSLYEQWLRDQRLLLDLTKGGDSNTRLERQKTYNRLRTQIEEMFRSNESRPGQKLLKQIERLVSK